MDLIYFYITLTQKKLTLPEGIEVLDRITVRVIVPTTIEVTEVVVVKVSTGVHITPVEAPVSRAVIVEVTRSKLFITQLSP